MSGKWSSRARAILLLLAARLLLGAGSAAADDAGALCGLVADGSGAPVPSAAVVVVELGIEARTGSDGRYEIKGIPAGSYAVEARAGGYSIDAAEAIEIVAGRTAEKDFQGVFSVLDPEMIDSVELVPGAFTSEYGDRMTGVLNITSRRPTENHGNLGISFTNAWASTGGAFSNGKGRWLGSLRRGYLDLVLDRVGDDDEDPPDPRYWDAFGVLGYDPSPRHVFALQALIADDGGLRRAGARTGRRLGADL